MIIFHPPYFLRIYFQDEQIAKWKKKKMKQKKNKQMKKCGFSFGRQIQSSCLGRVKGKLVALEKSGRSYKISKWLPTTKFCPNCGCLNMVTLGDFYYIMKSLIQEIDLQVERPSFHILIIISQIGIIINRFEIRFPTISFAQ